MRILGTNVGFIESVIAVCFLTFMAVQIGGRAVIALIVLSPSTVLVLPWTVISSIFAHASVTHLIFNMIGMYLWGSYLQSIIGEKRLIRVFFAGGLLGSVLSVLIYSISNPGVYVLGASGAIFAIAGALAMLRPNMKVMIIPFPIPMQLWKVVFGFMLILSFIPGTAWPGHLGGLVAGALMGHFYKKGEIGKAPGHGFRFN